MTLLIADGPLEQGGIVRHPDGTACWTIIDHNVLDTDCPTASLDGLTQDAIVWSGTLGASLDDAEPTNWMRPGRAALDAFCARIAPHLASAGRRLCFRPHARHVLSDPPSCLQFLGDHEGEPFDVALAPAHCFEPVMLDDLEDHLTRMFDALGASCRLVMLEDVIVDGDRCRPAVLGDGLLPSEHVHRLLTTLPGTTPVVISGQSVDRQRAWLSGRVDAARSG